MWDFGETALSEQLPARSTRHWGRGGEGGESSVKIDSSRREVYFWFEIQRQLRTRHTGVDARGRWCCDYNSRVPRSCHLQTRRTEHEQTLRLAMTVDRFTVIRSIRGLSGLWINAVMTVQIEAFRELGRDCYTQIESIVSNTWCVFWKRDSLRLCCSFKIQRQWHWTAFPPIAACVSLLILISVFETMTLNCSPQSSIVMYWKQ